MGRGQWRVSWGAPRCPAVLLLAWRVLLLPDLLEMLLSPRGLCRWLLRPSGPVAGSLLCRRLLYCPLWAPAWGLWMKVTPWMDQNMRRKRWPYR